MRCSTARVRVPPWNRSRIRTFCSSPSTGNGEWYRYHHLFRDLLRAELQRREPELVGALHVRAAEWCEANRMPELAIDHAQTGFDVERVNRLMLLNGQRAFAAGRRETVRRWLSWFEDRGPARAVSRGRGARRRLRYQYRRCGRRRTLDHCRGTSIAGALARRNHRCRTWVARSDSSRRQHVGELARRASWLSVSGRHRRDATRLGDRDRWAGCGERDPKRRTRAARIFRPPRR